MAENPLYSLGILCKQQFSYKDWLDDSSNGVEAL